MQLLQIFLIGLVGNYVCALRFWCLQSVWWFQHKPSYRNKELCQHRIVGLWPIVESQKKRADMISNIYQIRNLKTALVFQWCLQFRNHNRLWMQWTKLKTRWVCVVLTIHRHKGLQFRIFEEFFFFCYSCYMLFRRIRDVGSQDNFLQVEGGTVSFVCSLKQSQVVLALIYYSSLFY